MNTNNTIVKTMRVSFLILSPVCILLGAGAAYWSHGNLNMWYLLLAMIGGISAHISVNTFNEYYDYKSGLDSITIRTPFSGGSGALPEKPKFAKHTFLVAWICFSVTANIGIYFLFNVGIGLLPIGLFGLFLIYGYTLWITRRPLFCLIAPGLGFGTCMVLGTYFVLTGEYTLDALLISLIPFFLVSNLLLLNQIPDMQADKQVGRNHLPLKYGVTFTIRIYALFLLFTYLIVVLGVLFDFLPLYSLLGLITIILAGMILYGFKNISTCHGSRNLKPEMYQN